MLILTRKVGESIIIGDGIRVSVLEIKGRQVRIGVKAPSDVSIHREEIFRLIKTRAEHATAVEDPNETPPRESETGTPRPESDVASPPEPAS